MRSVSVCSVTLVAFCFVPLVLPSSALSLTAMLTDNRDQLDGGMPLPDGPLPEVVPVIQGVELGPGNVPLIPGNLEGVPPNPNGRAHQRANEVRRRPHGPLALTLSEQRTKPGFVTVVYDPRTGGVTVNSDNPDGVKFTTLQLESAAGRFLFKNATWYPADGADVLTKDKVFKLSMTTGIPKGEVREGFYMGKILPEDLSAADVRRDLTIDGVYRRRKDLPPQPGWSLARYCPAGEEAVLLHIVPADAEPLVPAASNPDADGLSEPSDGSAQRDEEPGDIGDATRSAGADKSSSPDSIEASTVAELRALREEVQALREAVEELTKRVDAAQHGQ